jgi:23S rRNA pseudouridine955/2504/2580 synthase
MTRQTRRPGSKSAGSKPAGSKPAGNKTAGNKTAGNTTAGEKRPPRRPPGDPSAQGRDDRNEERRERPGRSAAPARPQASRPAAPAPGRARSQAPRPKRKSNEWDRPAPERPEGDELRGQRPPLKRAGGKHSFSKAAPGKPGSDQAPVANRSARRSVSDDAAVEKSVSPKKKPSTSRGGAKPPAPTSPAAKSSAAKPPAAKSPAPASAGVQAIAVSEDENGMRLDRWFRRRWPAMGLSHLNKICRKGEVRVDGKRVEASDRLKTGNVVRIPPIKIEVESPAVKRAPEASPQDAKFIRDITLFEDRKLMVLNKPWGLAVQGGSGTTRHIDGMLQGMAQEMGERPVLVHRLDRDTSGVLLIAKTRKMAADLGEIFRSRQARKIYWAIVQGVPKPPQGRISLFLAKGAAMGDDRSQGRGRGRGRDFEFDDEPVRIDPEKMRIAKHGEQDAQHSITFYATVDKVAPRLAWLSMKPITGRTHQLRAHAEAIGHPIIGDPKYHGNFAQNDPRRTDPMRAVPGEVERKLHLLARRLILPNPSGGTLDVTAPLPPHMKKTFAIFGFDETQYDPIENAPEE